MELDDRVTDLEENGRGGGNSSVAELEQRVEALDGTAAEQETRLTAAEENIQVIISMNYLINKVRNRQPQFHSNVLNFLGKKITGIKLLNITFYTGLQAADVSFDARITALEENMGSTSNGKFYFA